MLGFVTPWLFAAAVVASLATVALHFLSVRRPPVLLLPTARFIAPRDVRAVSRSMRPSDLLLLLLRVLALLLAGAAIAGPRWTPDTRAIAHVIVADRAWQGDSARLAEIAGVPRTDDALVRIAWMDTSATGQGADRAGATGMRAELGAAWPLVWSTSAALLAEHPSLDSVAVHVMAPAWTQSAEGWTAWRAAWPGRVRVHVHAGTDPVPGTGENAGAATLQAVDVRGDDAVLAAFALHAPALGVRLANGSARAAPSATAASDAPGTSGASSASGVSRGVVLSRAPGAPATAADAIDVEWPASGVPAGWTASSDSVGAIAAGGISIVAPWARTARFAGDATASGGRVIAWWSDGLPAAVETPRGASCMRQVGVRVPPSGDLLLTASARGLLAALAAPCGAPRMPVPAALRADTGGALAGAAALRAALPVRAGVTPPWLPAALLGVSLALLVAESIVRRAAQRDDRAVATNAPPSRSDVAEAAA